MFYIGFCCWFCIDFVYWDFPQNVHVRCEISRNPARGVPSYEKKHTKKTTFIFVCVCVWPLDLPLRKRRKKERERESSGHRNVQGGEREWSGEKLCEMSFKEKKGPRNKQKLPLPPPSGPAPFWSFSQPPPVKKNFFPARKGKVLFSPISGLAVPFLRFERDPGIESLWR